MSNKINVMRCSAAEPAQKPLNKAEKQVYNRLKKSFEQIKLHQEGKIKLRDARSMLLELEAELD